jgi:hypothetical protein
MFANDYPRGVVIRFWLWRFAAFGALAAASALTFTFLLPCRRLPVSLLAFQCDHFRAAFRHGSLQKRWRA